MRGVLEVGPGASPDAIATLACRVQLERDGLNNEQGVRELVEAFGYEYTPDRSSHELRKVSGVSFRAVS